MSERTFMPHRVTADDVLAAVSADGPRMARWFSLTVAEDALQRMGPAAIEYVTERLAKEIAHEHHDSVEATVQSFLRDRAWAEPIIRQAIQQAVHQVIADMLHSGDPGSPP